MLSSPVQNAKVMPVRLLQETIDFIEKSYEKPDSITKKIFKALPSGSPARTEEKSAFDKFREKIIGSDIFSMNRLTKEEFKAKVIHVLARAAGIAIDKGGEKLANTAGKIRRFLQDLKTGDPQRYKNFIESLNKELGLNYFHLSVEDFIAALIDPDSSEAKDLDKKLDAFLNPDGDKENDVENIHKEIIRILSEKLTLLDAIKNTPDKFQLETDAENMNKKLDEVSAKNSALIHDIKNTIEKFRIEKDEALGTYKPRNYPSAFCPIGSILF